MRLIALNCDQCGAPLEVPKSANYVTCSYCEAQLSVQQEGGAIFTQKVDDIDARTRQIAEDVQAIRAHNEIEQLDRDWMTQRVQYQVRGKDGELSVPTQAGAMIGAVMAAGFGVVWIVMAMSMGAPAFFPIFGVFFIAVALIGGFSVASKAKGFERRQHEYRNRRRSLQRRLLDRD